MITYIILLLKYLDFILTKTINIEFYFAGSYFQNYTIIIIAK